ncbi:SGA1 [Candida theae]|uniref:glucan 1,4-alpha-glucosidase n=1 Tax=Candida theae TaxID=1198502 RepID=A0AAD5BBB8_9ASCO|nr:SGA1 [Candida theae]KAI5950058.1 SGA1 [Candida theae]
MLQRDAMRLVLSVVIITLFEVSYAQLWPYQILPPFPVLEGCREVLSLLGVNRGKEGLSTATHSTAYASAAAAATPKTTTTSSTETLFPEFETWLETQQNASFHAILQNINPEGVIVASPSQKEPNYYYQWIRDSAITVRTLISFLEDEHINKVSASHLHSQVINLIESYVINNYQLQRTPNKSGGFNDLLGLAEPKFNVDMTAFNEPWGRPQRDGPGLRAATIIQFLDYLNQTGNLVNHPELQNSAYIYQEIVKPDLRYICQFWNETGFDLWEEVDSIHFFTSMVQLKALQMGIKWSRYFNDENGEFATQLRDSFNALKQHIQKDFGFVTSASNHVIESPHLLESGERLGLDIATILAVIYTHENDEKEQRTESSASETIPFNVLNSYVLSSLSGLIIDMRDRYPINNNRFDGVALGRYPEDIYNGVGTSEGNPWFIATSTASEFIYQFIYNLQHQKLNLVIDDTNRQFFLPLINVTGNKYILEYNSSEYNLLIEKLLKYADSFLDVVRTHTDSQGRMSEQFNKNTGYMQGAKELTWSYSAVWNAIRWRRRAFFAI